MGRKNQVSSSMGNWQAESDHRTLTEAHQIQGDKARMRGVAQHQVKQAKALKSVDGALSTAGIRKSKEYKGVMSSLKAKC